MNADSEPLIGGAVEEMRAAAGGFSTLGSVKSLLALFLIFLVVVSRPFFEFAVAPLGGGDFEPSQWGRVLQGIFLVLFYALFVYLSSMGVF